MKIWDALIITILATNVAAYHPNKWIQITALILAMLSFIRMIFEMIDDILTKKKS